MNIIRKIISSYMNRRAIDRLKGSGLLELGQNSALVARNISLKPGCSLIIGTDTEVSARILADREDARIEIGSRTFVGGSTIIAAKKIVIGDDVLISWGCSIVDHNSHSPVFEERRDDVCDWRRGHKNWLNVKIAPVIISDKVWIGFNVCILKGVSIGEGSVIGAGSVVTKNVPPWTVFAGNPAKEVRKLK